MYICIYGIFFVILQLELLCVHVCMLCTHVRAVTKNCYMSKQLQIRNSTAEFLIFQAEDKAQGVQVFYQDENIWATQDAIAI